MQRAAKPYNPFLQGSSLTLLILYNRNGKLAIKSRIFFLCSLVKNIFGAKFSVFALYGGRDVGRQRHFCIPGPRSLRFGGGFGKAVQNRKTSDWGGGFCCYSIFFLITLSRENSSRSFSSSAEVINRTCSSNRGMMMFLSALARFWVFRIPCASR